MNTMNETFSAKLETLIGKKTVVSYGGASNRRMRMEGEFVAAPDRSCFQVWQDSCNYIVFPLADISAICDTGIYLK